jgi:hypothetical protein
MRFDVGSCRDVARVTQPYDVQRVALIVKVGHENF